MGLGGMFGNSIREALVLSEGLIWWLDRSLVEVAFWWNICGPFEGSSSIFLCCT